MDDTAHLLLQAVVAGTVATALLDLWTLALRRLASVPSLDWAMAGRWVGHMRHGRFVHDAIARATPVRGERMLGWGLHYATGIAFAGVLLAIMGPAWRQAPTLLPCMVMGLATVALPFLLMQPAMGLGIAASRAPSPAHARMRSVVTHGMFGLGLHAGAWTASAIVGGG
ncbi:DUF2938 domain-containing protein [Marilutibacter aestuarii]|uniref:DUF2938 domain-containing protein n=1 Tax=Marilutibacter aestuarii TaxID=1706195 RepID=A0A508AL65_9GAMM|nr:DUF2938 domain-containing protein [Lysobacter aestuarii]TQD50890.1 DUF2938 domain-containing protein [Lysobacter aestuarii]